MMSSIATYRFSLFLLLCTLVLILAGGLVTSHEAGLAVPDWPLSYGQFFPPMVGNVFWEHGHRMIAGTVGIFTFLLAVFIQRNDSRGWLKKLGWVAFAAVLLQALLGGLTVILMLPPAVSILHACLAQTFFCLVLCITYFLSPGYAMRHDEAISAGIASTSIKRAPRNDGDLKHFMIAVVSFIYLQLILGAVVRHTGQIVAVHVFIAMLVFLHVVLAVVRILNLPKDLRQELPLRQMRIGAIGLGLSTALQIFLGFGALIFTQMLERSYAPSLGEVFFTAAHQTTGAVILALSVWITLLVWR